MTKLPLGIATGPAAGLIALLGGELEAVPALTFDGSWSAGTTVEQWRQATSAGAQVERVVVAVWPGSPRPLSLVDQDFDHWTSTMETPFALWFAALAAGAERCADGGRLVAVVDQPDGKDTAGWGAETALADAVRCMVRSFAQIHHHRGVRANLVTWPGRLAGSPPASMDGVAGAVSLLLSDGAPGVTSSVIHLGGGMW
jgi:hypothetical protein